MLGQSLYIKSRRPGQLTLVWEMGGDKRGGSCDCVCWVTEGKGKGKCVCVCLCCRDMERMFVSACVFHCVCVLSVCKCTQWHTTPCGKVCTIGLRSYAKKRPACGPCMPKSVCPCSSLTCDKPSGEGWTPTQWQPERAGRGQRGPIHRPLMGPEVTVLWWKWRRMIYIIIVVDNIFKGLFLCSCSVASTLSTIQKGSRGICEVCRKIAFGCLCVKTC